MTTFASLGVHQDICRGLDDLGFTTPTPVQTQIIPLMLQKKCDIIGLAQTGTGKTAAFGIPIIQAIDLTSRFPQALVLCPTRELCMQVAKDLESFARHANGIRVATVYGGAPIVWQINAIARGAQIIVATPGRLNDILRRGAIDLAGIRTVVLDEADEMLQMGFQEEIDTILAETPSNKNSLLFSATMPRAVAAITGKYMNDPVEITVGSRNSGAENVRHVYYMARPQDRYPAMKRVIDSTPEMYGIIFCRTRQETRDIADKLIADGYGADSLHGDLSQAQRDSVMQKFRQGSVKLLVATDVAARGLDVTDLSHVINYNLPDDMANYTHRSGRTGRAGKTGTSVSIIHQRELSRIREIEHNLKTKLEKCPIPSSMEICQQRILGFGDTMLDSELTTNDLDQAISLVSEKLADLDRDELIRRFVALEFGQVLDYYKNAPDLNVTFFPRDKAPFAKKERFVRSGEHSFFTGLRLNVGKKDGIHAARLIGQINETAGMPRVKIGRIDIGPSFATIEAETRFAPQVQSALEHLAINGKRVSIQIVEAAQTGSWEAKNDRPAKSFRPGKKRDFEARPARKSAKW